MARTQQERKQNNGTFKSVLKELETTQGPNDESEVKELESEINRFQLQRCTWGAHMHMEPAGWK